MLIEAYRDLKYLLNRGYRKSVALNFVANHYRLSRKERYLLSRCVFPDYWIEEVRRKLIRPEEIQRIILAVDGFNVLITFESLLEEKAMLCEDLLVRDIKYLGTYRLHERTQDNLRVITFALKELSPKKTIFFYGKNTPKSGIITNTTRKLLKDVGIPGEVILVKSPDYELKTFKTVATADVGVLKKVEHVFDLARFAGSLVGAKPIPFIEFL